MVGTRCRASTTANPIRTRGTASLPDQLHAANAVFSRLRGAARERTNMLVENKRGGYSFLKGISPYSAGAVAQPGFAIEHARLRAPLALTAGFNAIDAHLKSLSRPRAALCGIELRSPQPFTFQGFADFNLRYVSVLKSWDLLQDGLNPIARTNVAPELSPPSEPALFGFSYTVV